MSLRADWLPTLAAFEAAARHQNFTHAAEELHLTASAVSHHVRKLEARLGVALFLRRARGVTLTVEGRQLADATGSALADVEGVLRGLRHPEDEAQRVRITVLHSLLNSWLIPRLPSFVARHPEIRLVFETEMGLTRFDDGGPDLGIRHGPGHWPGLTAHRLMDDTLFPVTSPGLPGIEAIRTPADIARSPLISDLARQGWHDWFRAAGIHGVKLDIGQTYSDTTDALEAAAQGLGIALARGKIASPWLDLDRLRVLPGPSLAVRWQYYIIHPTHRRLRPAAQIFIDWLLTTGDDSRAGG